MARYVDIDQLVDIDRFDYNVEPCVETVPIHRLINFYVCDPSTVKIADVREVTLCKNCKNASSYRIEGMIFCEDMECPNLEDGFCNHAVRRGGE